MRPLNSHEITFVVDDNERNGFKKGNTNFVQKEYNLQCHHLIWSEGTNPDRTQRNNIISLTKRKNECFFLPYVPNMLLPAAEKLFNLKNEKSEKLKDRAVGFVLGIIATILTGIFLKWILS